MLLASTLKNRECVVCIVRCDGVYKNCDLHLGAKHSSEEFCENCSLVGRKLASAFGIPVFQLKDLLLATDTKFASAWANELDPAEYPNAMYGEIPIGSWTISSVYRYFEPTGFRLDHPWVRQVHKQMLTNSMLTYGALQRILSDFRPDVLCLDNAGFAPYRVAYEAARARGLKVLVHAEGFRPNTVMFFQDCRPLELGADMQAFSEWMQVALLRDETQAVGAELAPALSPWAHCLKHLLRLSGRSKTLALFLASDRQCRSDSRLGDRLKQLELIDILISFFSKSPETLLIRLHPDTGGAPHRSPELDFLSELHKRALRAPNNIRFLMPAEQISDEDLLPYIDYALIPADSLLLKFAASGIPCIAFTGSPFASAATAVLESVAQGPVEAAITTLQGASRQGDVASQALRCGALLLNRLSKPLMPVSEQGYCPETVSGRHEWLQEVVLSLVEGKALLAHPAFEDLQRSDTEESDSITALLAARHLELRKIRSRADLFASARIKPDLAVIMVGNSALSEDELAAISWLKRSRYENINLYGLTLETEADFRNRIDALLPIVTNIHEDYVVLTHDLVSYEEWFISSAVDALLNDESCSLKGVFCGAWVKNQRERIEKEIFTDRVPADHFADAQRILPSIKHPLALAAFCVFRKFQLARLLEALRAAETSEQAAVGAFAYFKRNDVLRLNRPGLAVTHKHEVVVIKKHQER